MWAASDHFRQSVAKLVTHSAKFWNFLEERRSTATKNKVCKISPRPPNQCWSLFPALWSFRVWSTLCRGEGGNFYLGLGCSKIRQKRSSVSLLLKPIVAWWESAEFKFRKQQNVQNKQLFQKIWKYCKSHKHSVRNVGNDDLNYVCYS